MKTKDLKSFLDKKVDQYNSPSFISSDPISIPHQYSKKQDVEITGFVAAVLAWGQRKTIINKCKEFFEFMDNDPHHFILNHQENDLKPFLNFKHRTFNTTDALYFIHFFKYHYSMYDSLEDAFLQSGKEEGWFAGKALEAHFNYFFSLEEHPIRTYKHIPNPKRKSACKRLNMFLRWMVRKDDRGVDFGIWDRIPAERLICPCDVHVDRVGRRLGLITRKQTDWTTAVELTEELKKLDPKDPVKYDFALFGLGVEEK
ncbi:MAG: TIGR02757 family protein [Cyclobacteriaceae bacterium]